MDLRFVLASDYSRIQKRFNMAYLPDNSEYTRSYNITPGDNTFVITDYQKKIMYSYRFGMRIKPGEFITTIRAEGNRNQNDDPYYTGSKAIFLQPEYKTLIRTNRCLVLVDAIIIGHNGNRPYLVYMRGKNRPFALAGIYKQEKDPESGNIFNSFAIITTTVNRLFQKLEFKRMPVIVHDSLQHRWLRESTMMYEVLNIMRPYPHDYMNAFPISDKIKDKANNDVSFIQPTGKPIYVVEKPVAKYRVPRMYVSKRPSQSESEKTVEADGLPSWAMRFDKD